MDDLMQRALTEPFTSFIDNVFKFLPHFLTALLVLLLGILAAVVVRVALARTLNFAGVYKLSEKSGLAEIIRKSGIKEVLSVILARAIAWIMVITFLVIALSLLDIPALERLLDRFLIYLPNVFVASIILLFGFIFGNFLGRTSLIAAVNAGSRVAKLIGSSVKFTVYLLALTIALEQLGIGKETVLIAFAVLFGGVVLALALAFGLGGRDLARDYLEKKLKGGDGDDIQYL